MPTRTKTPTPAKTKGPASVATVAAYLAQLPPARRTELERVRAVILRHLPPGYEETLTGGMIVYVVPLARCPDTYNGQPLWYAGLAAPKSSLSLYLMAVYGCDELEDKLRDGFAAAGKKLDLGKSCLRFQKADDLALDTVGKIVASTPLERFVARAQAARRR
jgi:uncharacterized protein DUF1801